jgi:hypothetical protein
MTLIKTRDAKAPPTLERLSSLYVLSFQAERFYQGTRYYWTICEAQNPEELVSWGYARTQEQAEAAAQDEVNNLSSGLTKGGRVTVKALGNRHWLR